MSGELNLDFVRRLVFQIENKEISAKVAVELLEVFFDAPTPSRAYSKPGRRRTINVKNGRLNWTSVMDRELLQFHNQGMTASEIGGRMERTSRAIDTRLTNLRTTGALRERSGGGLEFAMDFSKYDSIVKAYQARSKRL